jgi:hypothetical protein
VGAAGASGNDKAVLPEGKTTENKSENRTSQWIMPRFLGKNELCTIMFFLIRQDLSLKSIFEEQNGNL